MKASITIVIAAIVCRVAVAAADKGPSLTGTFRSDKEATLARWREEQRFGGNTAKYIDLLGKVLGRHTMTITATEMRSEMESHKETQTYEVVRREGTNVTIRAYSAALKRPVVSRMELTKDGFWTYADDPLKNYCEKYTRVK